MSKNELISKLINRYLFNEAMAFYEAYYSEVDRVVPGRKSHQHRRDARPVTWVPLVFHATTLTALHKIIKSGEIRPNGSYISFSEIPLLELDRLKSRVTDQHDDLVAIAFPRRVLKAYGFAPVLGLKNSPDLSNIVKKSIANHTLPVDILPYIELNDDVSSFFELRTRTPVPIEKAVWVLLTPPYETAHGKKKWSRIKEKLPYVALSRWARTHQAGVLNEWQYLKIIRDENNNLVDVHEMGEHYYLQTVTKHIECKVQLPVHDKKIILPSTDLAEAELFKGPLRFIDVAIIMKQLLLELGCQFETSIPDRLIKTLP